MNKRILHVVTNVDHYANTDEKTGLWLTELTHAWDEFEKAGYQQDLVSPAGGAVPLEPRALKAPLLDRSGRAWLADPAKMALLQDTMPADQVNVADYDAIYYTGGHAVMYDFPENSSLQGLAKDIFERGGVVSSVCHGYCGLLNVTLGDGSYLLTGKEMTGFSWNEEILAGVAKKVPYNAEQIAKDRGALYRKAKVPFLPYVVTDGRLVTGQNPSSAKATARAVIQALS